MDNKIINEIKEMAPRLSALDRALPFRVPEAYFDSLEVDIMAQCGTSASDNVPEGYFNNLADKILDQVDTPETKPQAVIHAIGYRRWIAVAAMAVAGLFGYLAITDATATDTPDTYAATEEEDDWHYLTEMGDLTITDALDLIDDEVLEDMTISEDDIPIDDDYLDEAIYELEESELEELL